MQADNGRQFVSADHWLQPDGKEYLNNKQWLATYFRAGTGIAIQGKSVPRSSQPRSHGMSEVDALKPQTILEPISSEGLAALSPKGKANPQSVVTQKAKTVCESK